MESYLFEIFIPE